MYDFPETRKANDAFWFVLRKKLRNRKTKAPEGLTRSKDAMQLWCSPDLLVSQTCSYPYRKVLAEKVFLIGTPDLGIDDVPSGYYHSVLVVRREKADIAKIGETLAYNDTYSQSGWIAPNLYARDHNIVFASVLETGGHWNSAQAVATRKTTVAALDVFSWELIKKFAPFSHELKEIDTTPPTPGLPLITAHRKYVDDIYVAMEETINEVGQKELELVPFKGLVRLKKSDYMEIEDL